MTLPSGCPTLCEGDIERLEEKRGALLNDLVVSLMVVLNELRYRDRSEWSKI